MVSRLFVQKELCGKQYSDQNMSKHIDEDSGLFSQSKFMEKPAAIPDLQYVPMLFASVDQDWEMEPTALTLRT